MVSFAGIIRVSLFREETQMALSLRLKYNNKTHSKVGHVLTAKA